MSKGKKKAVLGMSAVSALLLFSACSSTSTPSSSPTAQSVNPTTSTDAGPIKLLYTKGGFEKAPDGNLIKAEIEKSSGVKFDMVSPPSADYAKQVPVILASNDKPDIAMMATNQAVFDYAKQGALLDLKPYLSLMPDVVKNIPKAALDYFTVDGKLLAIPVWTSQQRYNFIVRGDWLKKLGLQAPTTLDQLHDVLKAFVEKDPDGNGVKDTYGISGLGFDSLDAIFGAFGVVAGDAPWVSDSKVNLYYIEQNGKLVPQTTSPEAKAALTVLAQWYKEGLIDPEMFTQTSAVRDDKFVKNRYGVSANWWTWESQQEVKMKKNDPNVELLRIAPPTGPDGKSGLRGVDLVARGAVVLATTKHPEAAAKFMNYFNTDKGALVSYTGVEGVHWQEKDGKITTLPQFDQDSKWIQWYSLFENEAPLLKVETYLAQSRRDALQWKTIKNAADGMLTQSEIKYSNDLRALKADWYSRFVTGKTSLTEWDKFVDEFNKRGGQEWTDEVNKIYQQKKAGK
ncbi:extracellular solute-binding protein [Paenibacillus aestuarii]|uniref:Extracellular solute-binding protein n=1 Tax=Paenibacillus aestuarii TaxID=516965 RepID=A0ABW0KIA6_9BACL|nr:extracellular solute-binding protein [Paenibacillus aestuarii]